MQQSQIDPGGKGGPRPAEDSRRGGARAAVRAAARMPRRAFIALRQFLNGRFSANTAVAVFSLALIGMVWAAAFVHVQLELDDAIAGAVRQNTNLAKAFEAHTVRTLKGVDAALLLVRSEYARLGAGLDIAAYMRDGLIEGALFTTINIADEHGKLILGSETLRSTDISDREYFRVHVKRQGGKTYIGKPVQDPFSLTWSIPMSRRIDKDDGSFGGVVTAMVDPSFFTTLYKQADLGEHGVVDLAGLDGISRARQFGMTAQFGRNRVGSNLFKAQQQSPEGHFLSEGRTEGFRHYVSYLTLADYPLLIEVGTSSDEILADFSSERRRYYAAAGAVSGAIVLFAVLLMTAVTRQKRALQALAGSQARFRATFDQAAVGIAHISVADRRHTMVNQTLCDTLGYTREELLELPAERLIHPEDFALAGSLRERLLAGEIDTFTGEIRYLCKDGRVIWVNRTTSAARDREGRPLYLIRVTQDISAKKEVEQQFRATYDQTAVGIAHVSPESRYLRANAHFCAMVGYTEAELQQLTFQQVTHADDVGEGADQMERLYRGETDSATFEKRYLHRNGSVVWASLSMAVVRGADRQAKYHIALATDISGRKLQEEKIARLNRIRAVLGGINALIVRVRDRETLFREACKIAVESGNFGAAWIGELDPETLDVTPVAGAGADLEQLCAGKRTARPDLLIGQGVIGLAIRERRAVFNNDISLNTEIGGELRRLVIGLGYRSVVALPIQLQDRAVGNLALYSREKDYFNDEELKLLVQLAGDISFALEHIDQSEKLNQLAYYDALTGLPNRVLFHDLIKQGVAQTRRNQGIAAVLFLDLDGFKTVNDTLGHTVGDKLLKLAAGRLRECVREGDVVARFGGDEFAIMLSGLVAAQDASLVAQKILDAMSIPFELEGNETYVSASIGIALHPFDSDNADALIKNADAAMYGAKAAGRNNFQFYIAEMNSNASNKMQLGARLRRAFERQEFVLHYQPKIDLTGGRIVGFEALLRWQPPDSPLVQPADFIPMLEETGLIVQAGEWALRAACAQIAAWDAAGIEPVPIAVNLSARQFQHAGLEALVRGALAESGVGPRWLELEITESMLMGNPDAAIAVLKNLKALGIRISVDDFGTGYSSLSYLKRFPLDSLKVDRSFVSDIPANNDDTAIARAVITMAHSLGLKVIAEGVETPEQVAFLRTNHCDEGQGYLFSVPLPAAACTAWLTGNRRSDRVAPVAGTAAAPAVLLVDDDADCTALTRHLLAPDGYRILTASNAKQALERLAMDHVSVIVSDENMPGMSGVELLSRVKIMYPHVARIMMTGETDFQTAAKAINEGEVCKFFVKGRDDALLRNEVRRAYWSDSSATSAQQRPEAGKVIDLAARRGASV